MPDRPEIFVSDAGELAACCDHIATCPVFGFDTEFIGENTYHPHLCLVQVATPSRLFLFDPIAIGSLDLFWKLVADASRVAVVHAGREEIRLCRLWSGQPPGNLFDIQVAAGLVGLGYPTGHGNLVADLLGTRLAKAETLTDWSRRPLTPQQIRYAYDDVRYLLALHEELHRRLQRLNRLDWVREEFQLLMRRAVQDDPEFEPWRKLRGLGALNRQQLAVARALFIWRDDTAARLNRPARVILRDDLIVEVARRNSRRDRDLIVLRGFPRNLVGQILEVVEQARQTPADQLPALSERDNDPPQVGLVTNLLTVTLASWCMTQSLTPALVASSSDVRQLVRSRLLGAPMPSESTLISGWRATHVLPMLMDVLNGKKAIRVADLKSASPLEQIVPND